MIQIFIFVLFSWDAQTYCSKHDHYVTILIFTNNLGENAILIFVQGKQGNIGNLSKFVLGL